MTVPDPTLHDPTRATRVVALSGGLGYPSSTRALSDLVLDAVATVAADTGRRVTTETVEVRDHAHDVTGETLLGMRAQTLEDAIRAVESADVLIAATPVFRGSYAGLFKSFVDLLDPVAMRRSTVVVAATGGSPRHTLVLDHAMRPLFGYFGALVVPTGVYSSAEDWTLARPSAELADRATRAADQALSLAEARRRQAPARGH